MERFRTTVKRQDAASTFGKEAEHGAATTLMLAAALVVGAAGNGYAQVARPDDGPPVWRPAVESPLRPAPVRCTGRRRGCAAKTGGGPSRGA